VSLTLPAPARVGLLGLLLVVLFVAALLIGKASGTSASSPGPVPLAAPSSRVAVTAPPVTSALPALAPKPKPKVTKPTRPASTVPSGSGSSTSSAPPVTSSPPSSSSPPPASSSPPPSSGGGSGSGGAGGGTGGIVGG
jgi:hypothetical protein